MDREDQTVHLLSSERLVIEVVEQNKIENCKSLRKDEIVEEAKRQLLLAGPLVSVNLLTFLLQVISVMFVGHLGELSLAGASMATSFASVTGFSLLKGLCSALETFCGQSYGAKQYHMLGVHTQRAMLVLLLFSVPLACIWANTEQILLFLAQDPQISAEAGHYARFMIPSIVAFAVIQCKTKFLQSQNNVVPMMVAAGITTFLHVGICWLLVFKLGLGNRGAALANSVSYWINALLLVLYVRISPSCKDTWTGFSKEAFHGIPKFLQLAIPSTVMITLEIWSFELVVLLSGLLPNPTLETSVMSICLNTVVMSYMIPSGLGSVISVRVSNELGARRSRIARLAIRVALFMVFAESVVVATIMILGRHGWGYFYSTEERVVKYVGEMLILIAILHIIDGFQTILTGTVRGSGQQKIGAILNLGSYYVVGIPCSVLLAFVAHIGGKGLWMGIIVALLAQTLSLGILTICTDWDKEVEKASQRVH